MNLFEHASNKLKQDVAPLPARMRPQTLDELVGQDHIIGKNRALRKIIESGRIPSMILWGPPGVGKTTLAHLISSQTQSHFEPISAVSAGVSDLRRIINEANERHAMYNNQTVLFIDEIHRFNKAQQDVVLPYVEQGDITIIGATTENPSFEVIGPLLSRAHVFTLRALTEEDIISIINRALHDDSRGLGKFKATISERAISHLVDTAGGDARIVLNRLELAAHATKLNESGVREIELATIEDVVQTQSALYDKAGDSHYNSISAFIKSVRGSHADGALYWLGRMIEAGEDPLFIARRIVILASEDIGMADPMALPIAVSAYQSVHFIGMPEGAITLAHATVYLATAPKSNTAYKAFLQAKNDAKSTGAEPVPLHLRNAVTSLMQEMNYGKDYKYSHDYPDHFTPQDFLPKSLQEKKYYILMTLIYLYRKNITFYLEMKCLV